VARAQISGDGEGENDWVREIVKGHRYAMTNLKTGGESILQFHQDPELHGGVSADGPSTQEVIRVCIARVNALDDEKPWSGNADIIMHLRCALAGFEARAIIRRSEKGELEIEKLPVLDDGHIEIKSESQMI
jgi:hypothetical protein